MSEKIDLSYRPETYWPEALDQEQLLSRIKGQARRNMARQVLEEDGFAGLNAFLAREELDGEEKRYWGGLHPDFMGGEYLPSLGVGEVEIARISLASTTSDQISIRAIHAGKKIRYAVCDEYETEFELAFSETDQPLTLGELIEFIDGSNHPEEESKGTGLLVCHWEHMYSWGEGIEAAVTFAWIESAWYPQLAAHYEQVADTWGEQKTRERDAEDEDDDAQPDGSGNESDTRVA